MKIVLFQTIQFMALSGATTLGQSGLRSDGYERLLRIPQSSRITGTSPSDCLVSYPGHTLVVVVGGLTPLQRCSRCILHPKPIWQYTELTVKTVLFQMIQFSISTQFRRQNSSISSNSV